MSNTIIQTWFGQVVYLLRKEELYRNVSKEIKLIFPLYAYTVLITHNGTSYMVAFISEIIITH